VLLGRYPTSEPSNAARVEFAELLLRFDAKVEARDQLREVVAAGIRTPRTFLLLAQVEEALGEPRRARPLLQHIVESSDGELASEAAYRLGRLLSADGRHADALEWHMTAAYVAEGSRWARQALLEAGRCLRELQQPKEALIVYRKLVPTASMRRPEDRETTGEAAYRIGEILHEVGDEEAALDMYLSAANLVPDTPTARRALFGAVRSFAMIGDRQSAVAIYRRLMESSGSDAAQLAETRRMLLRRGAAIDGGAALPSSVRDSALAR
jgi:tetratricopeptide (TPR) repeat protein